MFRLLPGQQVTVSDRKVYGITGKQNPETDRRRSFSWILRARKRLKKIFKQPERTKEEISHGFLRSEREKRRFLGGLFQAFSGLLGVFSGLSRAFSGSVKARECSRRPEKAPGIFFFLFLTFRTHEKLLLLFSPALRLLENLLLSFPSSQNQ